LSDIGEVSVFFTMSHILKARIPMKTLVVFIACAVLFSSTLLAQDPTVVEAKFKVFGNCNMCKTRIEGALKIKEVKYVKWDKKSKSLKVAYLSPTITLHSLQQRVAAVGHDTEKFKAPDAVYAQLPGCCLYRDSDTTH
jgi:hypothetical protein